jgi:hypothetical protein
VRFFFFALMLAACSSRPADPGDPPGVDSGGVSQADPVDSGAVSLPKPSQCVNGRYEWACVTDCPNGPDPRCSYPTPDQPCSFRGLECEYFGFTLACDCDGVGHCISGNCPYGVDIPCGGGGLTCGPLQICVQVDSFSLPPPDMNVDTAPHCVDSDPRCSGCDCLQSDPCLPLGGRCFRVNGRRVSCLD